MTIATLPAPELLVLSADSGDELDRRAASVADRLETDPRLDLADLAAELSAEPARPYRRFAVARDAGEAAAILRGGTGGASVARPGRPLVLLFSGVADHYENMAAGLYVSEPVFRRELRECFDLLEPHLGFDLGRLLYPRGAAAAAAESESNAAPDGFDLKKLFAPVEASPLDRTIVSQPLLFAIQYALGRLWIHYGVTPAALAGYSIGEYVAACHAGVLPLADALELVARRARLVESSPRGAMLSVAAGADALLEHLDGEIAVAALAGPKLTVLSGAESAIADVEARLAAARIATRRLPTAHAYHSPLMKPVADELRELVARFELQPPAIPFLSNVTGTWISDEEATRHDYWVDHLCRTIRFGDIARELWRLDSPVFLELGPGDSLRALVAQNRPPAGIGDSQLLGSLRSRLADASDRFLFLGTLGSLWAGGVPVELGMAVD